MLTRNREKILLRTGDFNVRLTVFDKNPKFYMPEAYKNAWINAIQESLGKSIIHSNFQKFSIESLDESKVYSFDGTGIELLEKLKAFTPSSIRINVLGDTIRSWIVLLSKDCSNLLN